MATPYEGTTGKSRISFTHIGQAMRLDFEGLVDLLNGEKQPNLPGALPSLCVASHQSKSHTRPLGERFWGFDTLRQPHRPAPPLAEKQGPENWYFSRYNQPLEPSTYLVRGAQVVPGGFSSPDYKDNLYFEGRRLGFHQGAGCLLLEDGSLFEGSFSLQDSHRTLPASFQYEGGEFSCKAPTPNGSQRLLQGTHYYLGNMIPHWGHFLLDGISRLWFLQFLEPHIREELKFICLDNRMPSWGWDLLKPFGIKPENTIFAKERLTVEQLIVPLDSYKTHVAAGTQFQSVMTTIGRHYAEGPTSRRRVYLSRRQQASRSLVNESALEEFMRGAGFEIIVPENLTVAEQICLASSADVLAGPTGSSMYLAAFQPPLAKTLVFAPKNFLLADDYLLACIGQRNIGFALGEEHVRETEADRWKSKWAIDLSGRLRGEIDSFLAA